MKKLLLFIPLVILIGCGSTDVNRNVQYYSTSKLVEIDSCEYIQYPMPMIYGNAYTTTEYTTYGLVHAGNCKYCKQRKCN